MLKKTSDDISDTWYACSGAEQDVIVSTKVTLSRNLANFPFPSRLNEDESERVKSIVFDAFNFLKDAEDFRTVSLNMLDETGTKIMKERDVLSSSVLPSEGRKTGLILRNDGKISCTVNTGDHLHISSFSSGLSVESTSNSVYEIDHELQKKVQFAASYEFGYLTYSILNCGSGLSLFAKVHLPSSSLLKSIGRIASAVNRDGFNFTACYGAGGGEFLSGFGGTGAALGGYYIVSTKSSAGGTEFDLTTSMKCALQSIIKEEREARKACKSQHATEILNYVLRSISLAKSSLFIPLREAIEIISGVKFGKDIGLVEGIDEEELHALLYRVQEGYLEYVLNSGKFKFEKDIQENSSRKIERLRALVLQEAFENVEKRG